MAKKGRGHVDEALVTSTEKVLKEISKLYENGLAEGAGGVGLCQAAASPQLAMDLLKPRKKVTVMLVGNHSAGKSSFINWYIGDEIQKTGVAIETRGFTIVHSGKRRETLTGEATLRYFDFLKGFTKFDGIIPNLFTEISTSKEKNFLCVDLIDTPGLVDGSMQYPFNVEQSICWMADHVDLILIFLDPIGQATCKRTMDVVEQLNNGPHLEKVRYFMSKADAVEKEHDRQRVLIQITQNLASRIKNSHAFNLPTFYLPRDDNEACTIPNAIQEVCQEIDKAVAMTVQKNLRVLKDDCVRIGSRCDEVLVLDRQTRVSNSKRRLRGMFFSTLSGCMFLLLAAMTASVVMPSVCKVAGQGCQHTALQALVHVSPVIREHASLLMGSVAIAAVLLSVSAKLAWRTQPVFTKKDMQQVAIYKATTQAILQQESDLYSQYFQTLSHAER